MTRAIPAPIAPSSLTPGYGYGGLSELYLVREPERADAIWLLVAERSGCDGRAETGTSRRTNPVGVSSRVWFVS